MCAAYIIKRIRRYERICDREREIEYTVYLSVGGYEIYT